MIQVRKRGESSVAQRFPMGLQAAVFILHSSSPILPLLWTELSAVPAQFSLFS